MKQETKMQALVIVCLVVGVSFLGIMGNVAWGMPNPVGNFWLDAFGMAPEDGITEDTIFAKVSLDVQKRGAEGTDPTVTGYVWYDWDGDGQVDLGAYPEYGEIETCPATSGLITTTAKYPVGLDIWFQLHASGYEVVEVKREVPSPASGWDGETALSMPSTQMVLLDTSITVSVSAKGVGGTVAMVTESGDYNYTTYGTSPTIDLMITCGTGDAGIGQAAYTHWVTGKAYHGSFIAIKMALTEKSNVIFGDFDYTDDDGTSLWMVWDLNTIVFNDADLDDDGSYTMSFGLTIVGAFDWDEVNIYDGVLETNFGQYAFGTADGQETDLDFTA